LSTVAVLVAVAGVLSSLLPVDANTALCLGAPALSPGFSSSYPLEPGQAQAFRVWREQGQVLDAVVDQQGINLVVELRSPDGKTLLEVDNGFKGEKGPETIFAIAPARGNYCLAVRPKVDAVRSGAYQVRLAASRPGSSEDRRRALGHAALSSGDTLRAAQRYEAAIPYYREAIADFKALGDHDPEAAVSFYLGSVYASLGDPRKGCEFLRSSADLWHGRKEECAATNFLGFIEADQGESDRGLETVLHAQEIARRFGDAHCEGGVLNNLAVIYERRGELDKALDAFNAALRQWRAEDNFREMERSLSNFAAFQRSVGRLEDALATVTEAIRIEHAHGHTDILWSVFLQGRILQDLGSEEALPLLNKALQLARKVKDRKTEGLVLLAIGDEQKKSRQLAPARQSFEQSRQVAREIYNVQIEAGAQEGLGEVSGLERDWQAGLEHLTEAEFLYGRLGDSESVAAVQYQRARVLDLSGRLPEALAVVEAALGRIESLRLKPRSSELRTSFLAAHHALYELAVDLCMRLGDRERAFTVSERARARAVLDELAEAKAEVRRGVDLALLQQEKELEDRLAKLEQGQGAAEKVPSEARAGMADLGREIQVVQSNIRSTSPRYTALVEPHPLTLAQVQKDVLDEGTALLSYSLGEEHSFLWLVRHGSLATYDLGPRRKIEDLAHAAYAKLSERGARAAALGPALSALSRAVLGPVAAELRQDRILIVADGALQTIPFGALPVSVPGGERPLLVDHEIVSLPSASVLPLLRQENPSRPRVQKQVAVLGDPVFRNDDDRLPESVRRTPRAPSSMALEDVARSARDLGIGGFDRLPASKAEADAILRLVPPGQGFEALGFAADRKLATGDELAKYKVVHFATHAVADLVHPELSGIVLSLLDAQGRPQDGFLRAYEIYNLSLPVDLVVLSACQTALGPAIHGEGLSGLTRGFMYAGARRVLVSLWSVSDKGTFHLMERFYDHLLRQGKRPAAALRAAQVEMLGDPAWKSPYYWAGFILQGEWRR
jgi:CHAT domain-containing protein